MVFSRIPSFIPADTCMPVFTLHLGRYYLEFMNKLRPKKTDADAAAYKPAASSTIRAMTYNIHSCVNTDGAVRPEQVAKVIRQLTPDLVALQEVDAGIPRTHYQDQAKTLGELVDMNFRFFPVVKNREQKYGLAVLSRFPIHSVRVGWLPTLYPKLKLKLQKRGAIRAIVETSVGPVHFFNTHLSLYRLERRKQLKSLLGKDWLMAVPEKEPVIFCGDLNAGPLSPVYRRLARYLIDAQKSAPHSERLQPTFPSRRPFFRIDHIFTSKHFRTLNTIVPVNDDTRLSSDHLPLCADLQILK